MSFAGARLKLERAKAHINDLDTRANQFLRRYRSAVIQDDQKAQERSIKIVGDKPLPDIFGLIIGDAAHNLRGALDHVIWELVSPHNPPRPKLVQFPFADDFAALRSLVKKRQIDFAGPNVVAIVEDLRPYPGGDQDLVALNDLNNIDKHRIILTTENVFIVHGHMRDIDPSGPNVLFTDPNAIRERIVWRMPPTMNRQDRRAARLPAHGERVNAPLDIVFGPGQPLDGRRVVAALGNLATKVEAIINRF